ncbi:MAG: phosphoglycerate kinase, partial [Candidatus Blochmannia sp. A2]|nr:phosphoglycerate kinase [Serratia symbiotica]MDE5285029.1 phosphoglycerate kinase [Candidatus Blochmannia sp. A2]
IQEDEEIMDFGDETIKKSIKIIKKAKTIIWNGPVGVFEFPNFRKGTEDIAKAIAESDGFSVAGGGDTLSVIDMF